MYTKVGADQKIAQTCIPIRSPALISSERGFATFYAINNDHTFYAINATCQSHVLLCFD